MKKTHPVANCMNAFFNQYLGVEKGLSLNTILAYRDAIKLLLCFSAGHLKKTVDKLDIENLDYRLILAFLDYIESERHCHRGRS